MKCQICKNETAGGPILAAGQEFCSDVCHLRFWKEGMPNLGGRWIDEGDIERISRLSGQERTNEYNKLTRFILDNFNMTALMLQIRSASRPEDSGGEDNKER